MILVAGSLGAGCGWKVPQTTGPGEVRGTVVVLQNQDGEILGTKAVAPSTSTINLSLADVSAARSLSAKYIVVRSEPNDGKIGSLLASTDSGSVSFAPEGGAPVRAVFMSTEYLPEGVMDCYFRNFEGAGFRRVGRVAPGDVVGSTKAIDGDESVFTDLIADVNAASVDRQGIVLGQLSWSGTSSSVDIRAGFSDPPVLTTFFIDYFVDGWYVLVNPRASRREQTLAALSGVLCADRCEQNPCRQSVVEYLVDRAGGGRLSRQGVSLLRFGAYFNLNPEGLF